ncbi:hypothetical protein DPMN_153148 [Dreissena polymorpha]|uniref:Uncharacterized protein n=1 Tax=Dreissena polymorpha TaxID=45954 RepID=A0A9D4FIL7_DREPO|nr:hypothetical protein DPMN_153148 [Dreissena polymorpha]
MASNRQTDRRTVRGHTYVTSRVFTRKTAPTPLAAILFRPIGTIFELIRDINKTNVFTKKMRPTPRFKLDRFIIGTKLLTKFYEDRSRNVASRVFRRKTAPPTCSHVFQRTGTTFELNQRIIKTNILTNFKLDQGIIGTKFLTKFHEDRTRNLASRVFTNN